LPVSGASDSDGLLVSVRPTGSEIIGGGSFGPEGGLAATVVFVIGIALVLLASRRRGAATPGTRATPSPP
jgi:multisubunit Na+/H+ antiporter MnhB subunit